VQQWDTKLVACLLTLYRSLWDDRNTYIHGKTWQDSKKKLRERVIEQVISIHRSPPKLHPRFPRINSVPLGIHLRRSTALLQQWIERIAHQSKVSAALLDYDSSKQLTMHQFLAKVKHEDLIKDKFPHDF
jgi:hypothetical protein